MVICPDCGKEVPNAKFCKNCGSHLPEIKDETQVVNVEDESDIENIPVEVKDEEDIELKTNKNSKYCFNCGYELNGEFKFCPNCGYNLKNRKASGTTYSNNVVTTSEEKNILLAIILSAIVPGLGHFYLALGRKGAIFLFAYVISAVLIIFFIGFLLVFVVWIWALVDTIQCTNALNRGESVEDKLF